MSEFLANIVPAQTPYIPDCGDLLCEMLKPESAKYLEVPSPEIRPKDIEIFSHERHHEPPTDGEVLPLQLIEINTWEAIDRLRINAADIRATYECPYTNYECFALMPVCLISTDLEGKWGKLIRRRPRISRCDPDFVMDYDWHKHMHKDKRFYAHDVGKLLLGSGYTSGTLINDGSRELHQTIVNLDNGDKLWVYFWMWYNK